MKIIFANAGTEAPFYYATWVKAEPNARELSHAGTLHIGEPGVASPALIEVRLTVGDFARDPVVSGGTLTNRTDKSVFVQVGDYASLTEFVVDLSSIVGAQRVGTPVQINVFSDGALVRTITLGFIRGVSTAAVPFFNPPTNPRQQTTLVLNNHENDNWFRIIAVDAAGAVRSGSAYLLPSGRQITLGAAALYADVGAAPVEGNKLRLIVCSSAPLTVVSKVRDSDSGIMCDNGVSYV